MDQSTWLNVLARTPADVLKPFVDGLIPQLPRVEVLESRTGLTMLPYTDTRAGTTFHLGEVLVAEGRVRLDTYEGYGACPGRDLQQALAIAICDAALQGGLHDATIRGFLDEHARAQAEEDDRLRRKVEATRVEMETF